MNNLFKKIIAVSIGLVLAFLIAEILLTVFKPFSFRQKGGKIVLPSNFEMVYENKKFFGLDSVIYHSKNSLGFRGPDLPADFENWTSIIAVGGSTTECFYISDEKEWVALLRKELERDFEKIWVNNAGLDGHSTYGHQILLEDHISKINPDYILYLVGRNDVERTDLNSFEKNQLRKHGGWKKYLKNNSEVISLLVNLKNNLNARKRSLNHTPIDFMSRQLADSTSNEALAKMRTYNEIFVEGFRSRLDLLVSSTIEYGIQPILITQPCLVGKGIDETTGIDLERLMGGKLSWEKLELYNEVTRKIAREYKIPLIDLAQKLPKSTKLFYDNSHYTNAGSDAVFQIIFEELKEILK